MLPQNERTRPAVWAEPGSENNGLDNHVDKREYNPSHREMQGGGLSFAERAAAEAFGRNYIPPRYRNFKDVSPQQSLAARKATGFGACALDPDFDARFTRDFESAVRAMGAGQ